VKLLMLLNASPFSDERTYNALRLASHLVGREGRSVQVYLMGDAVSGARAGQRPRSDGYSPEVVLTRIAEDGGQKISACGSCLDTRGIAQAELADWSRRATLNDLADATEWADKVMVF
jgi:uncharacterized protein involved in oxidation of intracellular sulfur